MLSDRPPIAAHRHIHRPGIAPGRWIMRQLIGCRWRLLRSPGCRLVMESDAQQRDDQGHAVLQAIASQADHEPAGGHVHQDQAHGVDQRKPDGQQKRPSPEASSTVPTISYSVTPQAIHGPIRKPCPSSQVPKGVTASFSRRARPWAANASLRIVQRVASAVFVMIGGSTRVRACRLWDQTCCPGGPPDCGAYGSFWPRWACCA